MNPISFLLHIDKYLEVLIQNYGTAVYAILFLIIFLETGLVVTPFLPGDSLIFAAGAFAAQGAFNILLLYILLVSAAIIGDTVNYWVGHYSGNKISKSRFVKKEYLQKTQNFYEKYGGKTIILARFVPIVRTFAPFVAGIGKMKYSKFLLFNIIGGLVWVTLFLFAGFFFGTIPLVKNNFSLMIIIIIVLSILPIIIEFLKPKPIK